MKLDAVFFDMDGLMIDSESGGITACQKAGAHFGLPAGEVDRYAHLCIGANTRHSRELFLSAQQALRRRGPCAGKTGRIIETTQIAAANFSQNERANLREL